MIIIFIQILIVIENEELALVLIFFKKLYTNIWKYLKNFVQI